MTIKKSANYRNYRPERLLFGLDGNYQTEISLDNYKPQFE
jgi:hypothetical protein